MRTIPPKYAHNPDPYVKVKTRCPTRSTYEIGYDNLVYELSLLGCKFSKIAEIIGVSCNCLIAWMEMHPTFREAYVSGQERADAEIARALYHSAKGYSHPDEKISVYKDRATGIIETVVTPYTKHYPPNPLSIFFWLKNRQPDLWKDVYKQEHTGKDGGAIKKVVRLDLSNLNNEELDMLHTLGLKLDTVVDENGQEVANANAEPDAYDGATKQ